MVEQGTSFLSKGTLTGPPISLGEIYPYQSSSKWPPVEGRLPEPNIEWLWLLSDRKRRSAAKTGWIIMYNRITRILTINSRRSKLSKNNCQLWLKNWQFHFTKTTITDSGLADHHFKILSSWKYGATFIITWLIVVSENDKWCVSNLCTCTKAHHEVLRSKLITFSFNGKFPSYNDRPRDYSVFLIEKHCESLSEVISMLQLGKLT